MKIEYKKKINRNDGIEEKNSIGIRVNVPLWRVWKPKYREREKKKIEPYSDVRQTYEDWRDLLRMEGVAEKKTECFALKLG